MAKEGWVFISVNINAGEYKVSYSNQLITGGTFSPWAHDFTSVNTMTTFGCSYHGSLANTFILCQ